MLGRKRRTAAQLQAMMQLRIDDLAEVRRRARDLLPVPVVGLPWPTGDSWSVLVAPTDASLDRDVAAIIAAMQAEYDLT